MADPSLLARVRHANGQLAYVDTCPDCGAEVVRWKRKIGAPCHPCAQKRRATHGLSRDPVYRLLHNIKVRCYTPSATHYSYYGGRGIGVCQEWLEDPAAFVAWAKANGWQPGLEIDRIDNDGDYSPANCRFVSHIKNSQKRRRNKLTPELVKIARDLLSEGRSVKEVQRKIGVSYMAIWHLSRNNCWTNV